MKILLEYQNSSLLVQVGVGEKGTLILIRLPTTEIYFLQFENFIWYQNKYCIFAYNFSPSLFFISFFFLSQLCTFSHHSHIYFSLRNLILFSNIPSPLPRTSHPSSHDWSSLEFMIWRKALLFVESKCKIQLGCVAISRR